MLTLASCSSYLSTCSLSDLIRKLKEKHKKVTDPDIRSAIHYILEAIGIAIARGYLTPSSPSSYLYDLMMIPHYWHAVDILYSRGIIERVDPPTIVCTLLSF